MSGTIYLIGGGEIANNETRLIDDDIKRMAPRGSLFVCFPTAAGDSSGYSKTIQKVFGTYFNYFIATRDQGRLAVEDAIRSAMVIYLGGGKTELLMDFFREWNLVPLLADALARGAVIAGMSAGAQALSSEYIHEDDDTMSVKQGWGLAPVCCLVHAQADSAQRALDLYRKGKRQTTDSYVAIGERAALRLNGTEDEKIGPGPMWRSKGGSLVASA